MHRETAVLIMAAGRGTRAGGGLPKQWRPLAGKRVIDWSVDTCLAHARIGRVVVVLHEDDLAFTDTFQAANLRFASGGSSRDASVRRGLEALQDDPPALVLIHDAARPMLSAEQIDAVLLALEHAEGAAPAIEVTDALWTGADGRVTGARDRSGLYRAQTPQGFRYYGILAAHRRHPGGAADDVEVARAAGMEVAIVPGDERNLKITRAEDFDRAARLLQEDSMARPLFDVRTGNGFDVHRFGPGDHVMLCGVRIPHPRGLQGHSDADVGMHAVTDAIYGALAKGDIGQHFPPSDPTWKGAASEIFLKHACDLARGSGFVISHVDCTLICEHPKIGPHVPAMKAELARIAGLDPDRIGVKATTSERLGFTGREEGIAALATATLVRS